MNQAKRIQLRNAMKEAYKGVRDAPVSTKEERIEFKKLQAKYHEACEAYYATTYFPAL